MPRAPKESTVSGGTRSRPSRKTESKTSNVIKKNEQKKSVKSRKEKTQTKVARKTKPTYYAMVQKAIIEDSAHYLRGTSQQKIAKYILENYPIKDEAVFKRYLRATLRKAVEEGRLTKPRPHSYCLSSSEKKALKSPKKTTRSSSRSNTGRSKASSKKSTTNRSSSKAKKINISSSRNKNEESSEKVWVWQYYHDGWQNYYPNASKEVEKVYQLYQKEKINDVRPVRSGTWEYLVDFTNFKQTNVQHPAHTERKIRRVLLPVSEVGPEFV